MVLAATADRAQARSTGRREASTGDEPWRRSSIMIGASRGSPLAPPPFAGLWRPAAGEAMAFAHPLTRWMDAAFVGDHYRMRPRSGVVPTTTNPRASVSPGLIVLRFHTVGEGVRPYLDLGTGIMDISRPAVSRTNADGTETVDAGAEIFGFDWCYGVGGGIEWVRWRRPFGVFIEARVVNAPGRTRRPQTVSTTRAGLSFFIP